MHVLDVLDLERSNVQWPNITRMSVYNCGFQKLITNRSVTLALSFCTTSIYLVNTQCEKWVIFRTFWNFLKKSYYIATVFCVNKNRLYVDRLVKCCTQKCPKMLQFTTVCHVWVRWVIRHSSVTKRDFIWENWWGDFCNPSMNWARLRFFL